MFGQEMSRRFTYGVDVILNVVRVYKHLLVNYDFVLRPVAEHQRTVGIHTRTICANDTRF